MNQLQRTLLWVLRMSHWWEPIGRFVLGARRYQQLKDWVWQLYIRQALRGRKPPRSHTDP